jgi:tripartite-type tricarboxylate transporter receptor subunit TctC
MWHAASVKRLVMAALVAAIHASTRSVLSLLSEKTARCRARPWMAGTSPAMTMTMVASFGFLLLSHAPPVRAQETDFYRGKTMSMIVPIGPGGAYDTYGRLVAKYLPKHLAGEPVIVPRNMPGAGGALATNYMAHVAPHDGTVLAIITSSFATDQILHKADIKYDARAFGAIGRLADTRTVLFFWHDAPVQKAADLWTNPSTIASSTLNELPAARLLLMNFYFGTKMKLIPGYPSARDFVLSNERGETDGGAATYVGLLQLFPTYIQEKKLNIVLQFGTSRDPAMPEVPAVTEFTQDPELRQIFAFITSNDEIGRSLFTTPGVPPARLALLRRAFQDMLGDRDFRADAERLSLPLTPKSGEAMETIVRDTFAVSDAALAKITELMGR